MFVFNIGELEHVEILMVSIKRRKGKRTIYSPCAVLEKREVGVREGRESEGRWKQVRRFWVGN